MNLIDLTHPLMDGTQAYPGDPGCVIKPFVTFEDKGYRLTEIAMGVHMGTHLDAPSHFLENGKMVVEVPIKRFCGRGTVIHIYRDPDEDIQRADLEPLLDGIKPGSVLILDTGWHRMWGQSLFFEKAPFISPDAAEYLASLELGILGMDLPTPGRDATLVHRTLQGNKTGTILVESMANLDVLPDEFMLFVFPLKLIGSEGSPVRAVAQVD